MRKRSFALKLIVGVILLSFIIPIKPPVSYAQAKLCCKKFCVHHIKKAPEKKCHGSHKNTSDKQPIECCQNSCAHEIFREDAQNPTLNNSKTKVDLVSLKLIQVVAVLNWTPITPLSWSYREHLQEHSQPAPIYIAHSSLLI
jgi:hypothetical protein